MSMSSLGIKAKLLGMMAIAIASFVLLAIYSSQTVYKLKGQIEVLGLQRIPISECIGEIRAGSNAVPRFMWLSLAQTPKSPDREASLKKVTANWDLWNKKLETILTFQLSDQAKDKIVEMKRFMPKLGEVIGLGTSMVAIGSAEQDKRAKELLMKSMPPLALKLTDLTRELSEIVDARNNAIIADTQTQVARSQTTLIAITVLLGLLLLFVGLTLSSRLVKQLLSITESVSDSSLHVSSASNQLSDAADQLSSTSQEQAAAMEETTSSLKEISRRVETNVKGAEAATQYTRDVHSISEDTKRTMEELETAMDAILESNSRIEQLVKVIEGIGKKTEVISEIVFKTRLLSFNASIESERAGEHGRGFAVVAQEIGTLGQMSGTAAFEIAEIVKNSIIDASSIASENRIRVEKGRSLASDTSSKMSNVLTSLSNIMESTDQIAIGSKDQSQGIGQITISVGELNHSTQLIAKTALDSAGSSDRLARQAGSLVSQVKGLRKLVTGHSEIKDVSSENKVVPLSLKSDSKKDESNSSFTKIAS